MGAQLALVDLREERRPLRRVVSWKHVSRWKSVPLLECGHEGAVYVGDGGNMPQRKRCTKCAAFGDDVDGLKYEVPQ
jgi:hypothetical protein